MFQVLLALWSLSSWQGTLHWPLRFLGQALAFSKDLENHTCSWKP